MRIWFAVLGVLTTPALASHALAGVGSGNLSVQVTLTTDYVFRGISQTTEEAAIQAGLDFQHDSGIFVGVWGSNVDFPSNELRERPRHLEVDIFVGVDRELGRGWSGIATLIRYDYTANNPDIDYSYNEAILGLRYFDQLAVLVAYTDSAFGSDDPSFTYELAAHYPAPLRLDLSAGLGYSDLKGSFTDSYAFWSLGVSRTLSRFTLALSAFGTDSTARSVWGEIADDRLVFSITMSI